MRPIAKSVLSVLITGLAATLAVPAFASIGTTTCASSDGMIKRTETEIWGANPVTWTYGDQKLDQASVKEVPGTTRQLEAVVASNPSLGEEHMTTTAVQVVLDLGNGKSVSDFILCKEVSFPQAID